MSQKKALQEIADILREADKAYQVELKKAMKIADEAGVVFYTGEYGDGKYYVPNTTTERILEALQQEGSLEYVISSENRARNYAGEWISSSELC